MSFPLKLTLAPMEALSVETIPAGKDWQYEPKWDGFRCLAFRDGRKVELRSKSGQSLSRYFPEIVDALLALKSTAFVLDGELVVPRGQSVAFDSLLQRIHPAASRVKKLSEETPALLVVFDLLSDNDGESLLKAPLQIRRGKLEFFAANNFSSSGRVRLSPATRSLAIARRWFSSVGVSLDGIIAKRTDLPYQSGARTGMQKIKAIRTADCVVGGFRYATKKKVVGSLLLGLYDEDGLLHHVGFTSGLKEEERAALTKKLEALIAKPGFTGQAPGAPSRWSSDRSADWQPLKAKLVVEVSFDHVTANRFRHGTRLLRWRPDKAPAQCRLEQLQQKRSRGLALLKPGNKT